VVAEGLPQVSTKQRTQDAPPGRRTLDATATRQNILAVAREEFAEHGLSGARVDAIAARMSTTKRMIYYYFGSKDGLYLAVLEQAYTDIRQVEQALDLGSLSPTEAIRRMVEFTFDYHEAHPDFVRLVGIENIHHGKHLAQSETLRNLNTRVIDTLAPILRRGRSTGEFLAEIDPIDLHMMISAFCFYRVSNRHTFGTLYRRDFADPIIRRAHQRMIGDAIIGLLQTAGEPASALYPAGRRAPAEA
jgi:AcrR family transcriptional regulator